MTSFADVLTGTDKTLVNKLRKIIVTRDSAVTEKPGQIMRAKGALCYNEDGVFKYGLARTAKGFTFHSMVMYANPDIANFAKARLKGVRFQKGCLNIASLEDFDVDAFDEMLRLSAGKDFGPVITHYKKRNGKKQ